MSNRGLNLVGALAVVVALASAAALALAILSPGGDSAAPARTIVVRVPEGRPRAPSGGAAPAAPAHPGPVPALAEKPARGPAFAIVRPRPGARVALWREPGRGFVEMLGQRTEFDSAVVLSVVRARKRWLGVASPKLPNGRLGWIERDPDRVQVYWTKYSLHVDLSAPRLALRYGGRTVADFLVTVGAPGSRTPTGRYGITDALRFRESPYYGCCALALSGRQTHLPAGWIGGDRLAIHGTPGPVGGAESHGCIRATDATMRLLFRRIPLGTPVFVSG